ncbi:retrovirus-related pol polyprotein from transposon TNT 1-94 [Tanacetum coccineum]
MGDAKNTTALKTNVYKKAHSALLLCLDNKVLREVNKEDSVAGVWLKLETLYMTKSLANKFYLKKKLFTFYMHSGKKLSKHIDEFNKLIDYLANIDVDIDDKDQALMLLTSLPSLYDNFVETLLYGRESLTLEDVLSTLNSREFKNRTNAKGNGDGLYVRGRKRIMERYSEVINEGPFHKGSSQMIIAGGTEGEVQQGTSSARVLTTFSAEKGKYKADIRATHILFKCRCLSFSSIQHYYQVSTILKYQNNEPSPADNFQLDSGSSSTENLIESLSNSLALLTQSYKSHLPQTNNQLRASSNARNKATVQDGRVVVQDVRGRYNANNQGKPFQRNNARGNVVAGNVGGQNRGGIINPGPAKPIKCYNCNGLGHIARECPRPKRLQDSDYFKDKMLLMQAQENGAVLDEEQSLFLAGEQIINFDEDVDNSPENDLALNMDHIFEADECDAFDSDVDEGLITQTMFMTNLTSEDLIYDEAGTSYDSNTPSEVHDHDTFVNHLDEYHEVHEMQTDEQHNYVVDSDADYTSNSNIIPYDQYVEDNEDHVVQRNVSSVRNDALMSILDEMHEQGVQSRLANKPDMVVNDSVTSELARYKELVGEYEKRAKFELTDRERKIDEQMRIIISDRNRKETSLKSELHSAQILLSSTVDHYKSKTEEVTLLKKDFKQKEDKFLEEFLDIKMLKDKIEDRLYKQDQSVQTVHMLCKPKSFYDEKHKVAIGYKNPLCLTRAKQTQSALYNGHVLVTTNHTPTVVHDSEDTREIAEITRKRMLLKMQSPLCVENKVRIAPPPPDYSKENLLATFAPQRNLTPEQIFWSIDDNNRKKAETSVPKPISALTVYPPNTPVSLSPEFL